MVRWTSGVVTTRNHVRYVVTEHGVADLYAKTIHQRARALIDVAAPEFREALEEKGCRIEISLYAKHCMKKSRSWLQPSGILFSFRYGKWNYLPD